MVGALQVAIAVLAFTFSAQARMLAAAAQSQCAARSSCVQTGAQTLMQCAQILKQIQDYEAKFSTEFTPSDQCSFSELELSVQDAYLESTRQGIQASCMTTMTFTSPCVQFPHPGVYNASLTPLTDATIDTAYEQADQVCDQAEQQLDSCRDIRPCKLAGICNTCYELSPLHDAQHEIDLSYERLENTPPCRTQALRKKNTKLRAKYSPAHLI